MTSKDPVVIPDGYSRRFYIKASEGLHGAISGMYRPLLTHVRIDIEAKAVKAEQQGAPSELILAEAMARQITEWDAVDEGNKPVPINRRTVSRLAPVIYGRLWRIIIGQDACDPAPDPDDKDRDREESIDDIVDSAFDNEDPGKTREEKDRGNSETA